MITIAPIVKEDLPQLAVLYDKLVPGKPQLSRMEPVFEKISQNEDHFLLGAKTESGQLIGSIMGIICQDLILECRPFMAMENMIVHPDWQGKGAGKMLLSKLESIARKHQCIFIEFCSSSVRTGAHQFYYAMDYDPDLVKGFRKFL